MRLGLNLGYWGRDGGADHVPLAQAAEDLGYDIVWAAEAYGSDVVSVLSWVGASTSRIGLGSAVMQIPARSAAMTAMTAATLDAMSGGRFHLGIGVSGPQVSEGWHGVRFAKPLARTREYADVVRMALSRKNVEYHGEHQDLPLPDSQGKALRLTVRPTRAHIPLYLAAVGPKNLELAGEIADGWLAIFFAPEACGDSLAAIRRGIERRPEGQEPGGEARPGFDIVPTVPLVIHDDLDAAIDAVRPYAALYIGGMGSRRNNFYNDLAVRMGYGDAAREVQDLYLAGKPRDAAAAVPPQLIDDTALVGPAFRVAERMSRYSDAGVTTLSVSPHGRTLEEKTAMLRVLADARG